MLRNEKTRTFFEFTMAYRSYPLTTYMFLLLPLLCTQAILPSLKDGKPKPFDFLEHLQGCHKGESVKGIHELKQYLKRFGYLDGYHKSSNITDVDDDFDDLLESAIKTYQLNYRLNSTGVLDFETVKKMTTPRCGVPDIINGTTTMWTGKKKHHHGPTTLHTVSHYSLMPGLPRWPNSKSHLTYSFLPGVRVDIMSPICERAFARWSSVTHFTFQEIQDISRADITIGFYSADHGDGSPFSGPGGTLAHAFSPTDGRLHFNADQNWATILTVGAYDLESTTLHEIGHLLGLGHSSLEDALMYPMTPPGVKKDLHVDDVQGIRTLYNL